MFSELFPFVTGSHKHEIGRGLEYHIVRENVLYEFIYVHQIMFQGILVFLKQHVKHVDKKIVFSADRD